MLANTLSTRLRSSESASSPAADRRRLLGVDYCRGVAAVLVVMFHASADAFAAHGVARTQTFMSSLFEVGMKGVDFFLC